MSKSRSGLARGVTERPKRRRLTTARDISEQLGIPLTNIYDRTREGRIPGAIRIGRRILYDLDKLEAWLDAGGEYAARRSEYGLSALGIPTRYVNALLEEGIETVEGLRALSLRELGMLSGIGPQGVEIITQALRPVDPP